jgi:hypothetical protein
MKKIFLVLLIFYFLVACTPSPEKVGIAIEGTLEAYTPEPSSTPYPTLTPYSTYTPYPTATKQPTIMVTRIVVQTPTPKDRTNSCKPMTNMDYSNNTNAILMLQAYVATLPDVQTVSYTVNEKVYSNTLSQLVFVRYVSETDGQVYSKRYIVYLDEFGWSEGVYSIEGQCFVDGPH